MYRDAQISVVVPAYNESGLVGTVVDTMPGFVDRIYVVDDCSTDDTWDEILRAAERANSRSGESSNVEESANVTEPRSDGGVAVGNRVVPIRHETNQGVGAAVTTGYRRALDDGMDAVAVMNGDAQMDPAELPRLLDPVVEGRADYAKGNRLLRTEFRRDMSRWRLFGNWLLTFLTKAASGYWKTMDPQNGYTAISREALEAIGPENFYQDYGFCNDVLVKLNAYGYTVADVPMPAVYGEESSSIRYSSFVPKLSVLLLRGFLWRLRVRYLVRDFHPLALCYLFGAVSVGAGGVAGLAAALSTAGGGAATGSATGAVGGATAGGASVAAGASLAAIAATILVPVGCLALLAAMTLDVRANRDREVRTG